MRAALIGFGSIAEHAHLPALLSFRGIEVVAVADLSPERRSQAQARLPGARLFTSPEMLIETVDLDLVDICTPPANHAELVIAACRRRVPAVICEKPFVLSERDFARVARARAVAGNRVISVNNWEHSDLNRAVLSVLATGEIGTVREAVLRTERLAAARGHAGWNPAWRTDPTHAGGGILLDHGWHQLYLMFDWLPAPVQAVRAHMRTVDPRNAPVEDEVTLDLECGAARGRIELRWTAEERRNDGWIEGDAGRITIADDRIIVQGASGRREVTFATSLTGSSYQPDWFRTMFAGSILGEKSGEASRNFAQAGLVVSVVGAAYRSAAAQGAAVRPVAPDLSGEGRTETMNVGSMLASGSP